MKRPQIESFATWIVNEERGFERVRAIYRKRFDRLALKRLPEMRKWFETWSPDNLQEFDRAVIGWISALSKSPMGFKLEE